MSDTVRPLPNIRDIFTLLPHRYPFLMVDRVIEFQPGVLLRAIKNVTINEPFFQGHFPGLPVMPGVLILEAMAQTGGLFIGQSQDEPLGDRVFLFSGMDNVRFRKPVVPGDQLVLTCTEARRKFNLWKMRAMAEVDGRKVAEADLSAAVVERSAL
ncbi:3-hydroxyacyl-ACP dehydratase FabZ [Desulfovibrio sulfodismutans]|uniref:3-hydroxyacyl-[acyl-carrier-protein] dehydratase FabZ n=1 Tax=Desulfolutivibrio sulfodismutans TaxID=63561 RepID=A0A7K3NME4_9BACT|nr:3-hydroxyacyl-ACP dehydratase FabZ [Desulfolutivibrio sulfodismutans]NDY57338.1 3-hydroxyacyl-ACP dehydratase FabZ [Desulfolutivibrio sulfodismutans]QLA13526.1 3-hydroxyacyl-ACP dehydratase FabZ [Desulfolutivibrio sulfodismutans DSM 3696]